METGDGQMIQDSVTMPGRQDSPMMSTRSTLLSTLNLLEDGMMRTRPQKKAFYANTQVRRFFMYQKIIIIKYFNHEKCTYKIDFLGMTATTTVPEVDQCKCYMCNQICCTTYVCNALNQSYHNEWYLKAHL